VAIASSDLSPSPTPALPYTDVELMQRAATGEVGAFAEIYDRHAPALFAVAQRMLGIASEAQDLLQDVFLEAWQSAREYDPARASVRTWLLVRARSRALDRMSRRTRDSSARNSLTPANPASALHMSAARADSRLAVRQALDGLDVNVRNTLELTYFGGLNAAEIADVMQIPVGTVKSRLARGLQKLEQILSDLGKAGATHGE
jgi:RNA polymerase sigma-70 factor, ECF subfamily